MSTKDRALLAVELIETLTDWALYSEKAARPLLWQKAQSVAADFNQRFSDSHGALMVRTAAVKSLVRQGQVLREESQLMREAGGSPGAEDTQVMQESRLVLKQAVRESVALEKSLSEILRQVQPGLPEGDRLSEQELLALEKQAQYWTAIAYLELGRTFPEKSEDFVAGVTAALQRLKVLAQLPLQHPLGFPARLGLADAFRVLRDGAAARAILEDLGRETVSPPQKMQLLAAWLRWAQQFRDEQVMRNVWQQAIAENGPRLPELDYALLNVALELKNIEPDKSQEWHRQIQNLLEALRSGGETRWARQAEMLVHRARANEAGDGDFKIDLYAAENAVRAGRFDEALTFYDRAATAAASMGKKEEALRLAAAAAASAIKNAQYEEAWRQFSQLAEGIAGQPHAPVLAYAGLVSLGQLAAERPEEFLPRYENELKKFLQLFPQSAEGALAQLALAQLLEKQTRLDEALDSYLATLDLLQKTRDFRGGSEPTNHRTTESDEDGYSLLNIVSLSDRGTLFRQIFAGLDHCMAVLFKEFNAHTMSRARQVAEKLLTWAEHEMPKDDGNCWVDEARRRAARLLLNWGHDVPKAQAILKQHFPEREPPSQIDERGDVAPEGHVDWITLYIEALAWRAAEDEAKSWLIKVSALDFKTRWAWAEDFLNRRSCFPEDVQRRLAGWVASLFGDFNEYYHNQTVDKQRELGRRFTELLFIAGVEQSAVAWLRRLAEQFPDYADFQENLALVLAKREDVTSRREARQKFQDIIARSEKGSPRWLRAQYMLAWLFFQDGQYEQARQIVTLVEALYPEFGTLDLREKFLGLKSQCELAEKIRGNH